MSGDSITEEQYRRSLFVLAVLFLFVWIRYPVLAIPYAGHDDGLFFRHLESIARKQWLGPYDNLTLVKGPLTSVLAALGNFVGISAKLGEGIIYAIIVLLCAAVTRRLGLSRHFALLLVFLLFANPQLWDVGGRRFLREIIYTCWAVGVVLSAVCALSSREPMRTAVAGLSLGLFSGAMYLTREEDIWIIPAVATAAILALVRYCLSEKQHSYKRIFQCTTAGSALFAVGVGSIVAPILYLNSKYYGRAIVSEFRAPEFRAAVGALMRVGERHPSDYVPVSQAAMTAIFDATPIASTIKAHWIATSAAWAVHGAHLSPTYSNELAGGWFVWALRDAVAASGYHRSADTARNFYVRLAKEVNDACDTGRLSCRQRRDTLAPELRLHQLPALLDSTYRSLLHVIRLSGDISLVRSHGNPQQLLRWSHLIGPVVEAPPFGYIIRGWIAHPLEDPAVTIKSSKATVRHLQVQPAADVVAGFAKEGVDLHAIRFTAHLECLSLDCSISAFTKTGDYAPIVLGAPRPGPLELHSPWRGYVDFAGHPEPLLGPLPLERERRNMAKFAANVAGAIVPALCVAATLGFLIYPFVWRLRRCAEWLFILGMGAASAVLVRCALIAYIDITSWRAVTTGYLGPAYPFIIIYSVIGTAVLFNCILRRQSLPMKT